MSKPKIQYLGPKAQGEAWAEKRRAQQRDLEEWERQGRPARWNDDLLGLIDFSQVRIHLPKKVKSGRKRARP